MIEMNMDASAWKREAKCRDMNPAIFEVPDIEGGFGDEERERTEGHIETAQQVCEYCPVKRECLDDAKGEDLRWTVRGGLWPTALNKSMNSGFKLKTSGPHNAVNYDNPAELKAWINQLSKGSMWQRFAESENGHLSTCKYGHVAPRYRSKGTSRCLVCYSIDKNLRRRKHRKRESEARERRRIAAGNMGE